MDGTRSKTMHPPSQHWYEFAKQAEAEASGDAGAGQVVEEFLPTLWAEDLDEDTARPSRRSWFWPTVIAGALVGGFFAAAEYWRRSDERDSSARTTPRQHGRAIR